MKAATLTNQGLLEAILSGDNAQRNLAYKQIYLDSSLRGKIRSMSAIYNISEADTEDLVQEAMVRLDRIILGDQFRGESAIITFLISVIRNLMRDKVKTKGRIVLSEKIKEDPNNQENSPETYLALQEKTEEEGKRDTILQGLLGKLKADCQKLLANYYYLGMSMTQVASEQGLSNANQAKKAAYRCRQHLRDLIQSTTGLENYLKQTL